jgi:hypothetical protein
MRQLYNKSAFPLVGSNASGEMEIFDQGMELRDYFAAKAMQGILASGMAGEIGEVVSQSFQIADAMIQACSEGNANDNQLDNDAIQRMIELIKEFSESDTLIYDDEDSVIGCMYCDWQDGKHTDDCLVTRSKTVCAEFGCAISTEGDSNGNHS